MGRQQYLTRLALGRSPFLEATNKQHADVNVDQDGHDASNTQDPAHRGYTQQYNSKGRPINPATEARNVEMRRAQNSVLALVGVVESREQSQRESEVELGRAADELREAEDDTGAMFEIAVMLLQRPLTWWIDSMSKRYQIGLYDSRKPFTYYLRATLGSACTGGIRGASCALFAGGAAGMLHAFARMASHLVVELTADSMKEAILRQGWRSKTARWLELALQCLEVTVLRLLPWHPLSFHAFGWKPLINMPVLGLLCSPAALVLFCTLVSDTYTNIDLPIFDRTAKLRISETGNPYVLAEKQPLPREPFAWLLYPPYNARVFLLHCCGWDLLSMRRDPPSPGVKGYITVRDGVDGLQIGKFHRMTSLAHMSAQFLASSIDDLLYRLATLPLDVILSRAVAVSYITSPLPKTLQAASMDPWLYAPLGSGLHMRPLTWSLPGDSLTQIGAYASKIGLSIALWSANDVFVFAGLHALVRSQGMRHFGWARSSSTRSFEFPESLVPKSEPPLRRESTAIPSPEER
ncbi:hypothetical protein LTS16_019018 [Friedmanniomyces endolithicus]|nr:hypothetical protein LTS02_005582 [Friedmanniomyces endolithicus]KAK0964859.1 hypothetical protein LTS01_018648 [Friedmanniomyces endolithicus]KAK1030263.1 hypothetical protein LTS16_019018 [Friedmanniomyces endolithicus]